MTSHQLAYLLLSGPDLPVVMGGYESDDGFDFPVTVPEPSLLHLRARDRVTGIRLGYDEPESPVT